jgi:DNA-binding CsgD family transcriptional regulator
VSISFSLDEVERLVGLASSAARGRTVEERIGETYAGLKKLVPHVGGNVFVLDAARETGDLLFVERLSMRHLGEYVSYYRHHDPMGEYITGAPNEVKTLSDAATAKEVGKTEFSDLLGRSDIARIAGWSQAIGGGRYVVAALHRPREVPDFEPRERAIVALVMPLVVASAREHLERPTPLDRLTRAERAVAELVMRGLPDREIGARLGIAFATVRTHLQRAFRKLNVSSRTELQHAIVQGCPPLSLESRPGRSPGETDPSSDGQRGHAADRARVPGGVVPRGRGAPGDRRGPAGAVPG